MLKSLVTGGAGFIGSHVVDELISMGHQVTVLDDLSGGFRENVNPKAELVVGNILEATRVDRLFKEHGYDFVFHLAAYAAEGLSHFIKRFNYQNNLIGSVNLINASINCGTVKCFVFTSSIAVYGKSQVPMDENMVPRPEDPYGIAKLGVEQDLRESFEMFGLSSIIFRPHNVYGERQNIGDRYRNVIGIFINQLMAGEDLTVFGDGTQTRAFSHVADVAPVIARSVDRREAYNEIFNIGADTPYSINHLLEVICKTTGANPKIRHLPSRNEVLHAYSTHEKAGRVFRDLMRNVSLEEGIRRMADWAQQHGRREPSRFGQIEVSKNLPESWR